VFTADIYIIGITPIFCQVKDRVFAYFFENFLRFMEISGRFAEIRVLTGLNKKQFADSLGVNQSVAGDIELGKREPSREVMLKLTTIYKVNINWLLTGEGSPYIDSDRQTTNSLKTIGEGSTGVAKSYRVPVLKQRVSCGPGMEWETEDNIEDFIEIDTFIPHLGLGRVFATKAHGSSMRGADIKEGDFLFFDASADFRPVDGIYIFALDGEVTCKRLEFDKLTKRLYVYSVRHADLDKAELVVSLDTNDPSFADRFCVFGRVVRCIRLIDIGEKSG
jgi:SOS-response transcriptional repressor LexA